MPDKVRIPDVSIFAGRPKGGPYPAVPPLAVIEVLSPGDNSAEMYAKFDEYAAWGVGYIFEIDPERRTIRRYLRGSLLLTDAIEIPEHGFSLGASELFATLDERN
jgi:Uma2 family endonuclease